MRHKGLYAKLTSESVAHRSTFSLLFLSGGNPATTLNADAAKNAKRHG